MSAWRRLSPGRMTLRPRAPQPPACREKAELPNTGSRGESVTSALEEEAGGPTGARGEGRQPGAEASEAGRRTETRDTGTEVSCSSSDEEEPNRDCSKIYKLYLMEIENRF